MAYMSDNCCEHNHNCIEELKQDHKKILESIDALQVAVRDGINKEEVKKFLDFTQSFAEPHHHKEENVLFPKLEEKGIPREGGPIGMMLLDHETKRGFVKNLREALENNDEGKIKENALAIINLMRDHIYKEDNILYPCAEDVLTEVEMNEMGAKCSEIKS